MILKQESEIWVQALYGNNWEDFEECVDIEHAEGLFENLMKASPNRPIRIIKKGITETLIKEKK